jgi:sodium-coupled neutral amino acid transporter 11
LGFLEETQGDVINNFDPDTLQANAARVLLALTMFFTYPMEALVARHVLMKLLFDGDLDGDAVDPNTGEAIPEGGFLNRRVKWTLIIYVATLLPALFLDDLGPVLSVTGAIGGCCLAYIGPGLVYLGTHGDSFLAYLAGVVDDNNRKSSPAAGGELPVAGNTNLSMQTTVSTVPTGPKPWWWYLMLMPLWVRVASSGEKGMQERLAAIEQEHGTASPTEVETIGPCKRDYCISIFFIVFGAVAGVAGVISNVYVQVNNIFYTPT